MSFMMMWVLGIREVVYLVLTDDSHDMLGPWTYELPYYWVISFRFYRFLKSQYNVCYYLNLKV